jgi:hypothetical protein
MGQRRPRIVFLEDGRRFIWESQRNGWNNFYLYDLGGELIAPLTSATNVEAATLVKVDERAGLLFYTARDGDNVLKLQLHRVGLDGKNDRRLTDPAFHHTIGGCIASLGVRFGQAGIDAALRHRAGQPSFHRHLSDARHSAGDSAGEGRRRLDRRCPGGKRYDDVGCAPVEEGGALRYKLPTAQRSCTG